MQLQRKYLLTLVVILLILFFPVQGLAAPKFTIEPRISASWRVDNNFYRAEAIDREVHTYLLAPGIDLGVETAKSHLTLDYTLNDYNYDDKDPIPPGEQAAGEEDYVGHTARLEARYRPLDRVLLGLDESYYKTRDPAYTDPFRQVTIDRNKYSINRLTPSIFYDFGLKFTAGLRYRNTQTDYDIATSEDSTENRSMFDLVYNFTRLTSLDLEYQRWKRDYDLTTSDYTSDQIKLIYRRQFKYFSLEAGGGHHDREFDDPTLKDIDVFTYRIAITGQNPPAPEPWRSHITFSAEQNFNEQGIGESYFEARRFSLDAGHIFEEKILVGIEGYYQISDYETQPREDKTYDISGSVGYMVTDWLTFSITAGFEDRESNLAGYDYDNRYYMAKLDFVYNLGTR
jgi:hypothetical protein